MNIKIISKYLITFFTESGIPDDYAKILKSLIFLLVIFIIAYISNFITKKILISIISRIIKKSKNIYDDVFLDKKVFNNLSHIVPALVIYELVPYALSLQYTNLINAVTFLYIIVIVLIVVNKALDALHSVYLKLPISKNTDIKGYVQVIKILFFAFGAVLTISIILDKSPGAVLTGLGAMTAILLLIFKDTLLGFVASIQLSSHKMLKVGDWITVPSKKADGDVIEINLNTVKVQNFDKTITTIPTYSLVSDSFKNWKGMRASGGRRIKRSVSIDIGSIKFCTQEMIDRFEKIELISDYIKNKKTELAACNINANNKKTPSPNIRQITNIGTFRIYLQEYLESLLTEKTENTNENVIYEGKFASGMTLLVRQLEPTDRGLPIQIYVFASTTVWTEYEKIQSDLFDHILAVIPEFDLKVFQNPTGNDLEKAMSKINFTKNQ